MEGMNPKVDTFLENTKKWQEELKALRMIMLDCGLKEELKWKQPCYTFQEGNVAILSGLKDSCVLSFFKGSLLNDSDKILAPPGPNSQAARQIRFTSVQEIREKEPLLKTYIYEAIEVERAGLKVEFKEKRALVFPEELQKKLNEDSAFKAAFEALTSGRQRGYNLFFSAPKQSKTRASRINKMTQRILDGVGMHDCTCGLSKRMPNCDGSHKSLA